MSTQKTYEQRVYSIAEKMRQRLIDTGDSQRLPDDAFIPILAVEAVNHMKGAVAFALCEAGYDADCAERWLIEQGLIPDQEVGKKLGILKLGEPGYGGYYPNNPQPDCEHWPPAHGMENKPFDTTGKWFNVRCQKCGWKGSSEFLDGGVQIADTGDYSDTYCPNCGEVDPDEYIPEQEAENDGTI